MIKLKLRKIGNSLGVILPANVITGYKENDVITLNVITEEVITEKDENVITSPKIQERAFIKMDYKGKHKPFDFCPKHKVFYNSCKCQ